MNLYSYRRATQLLWICKHFIRLKDVAISCYFFFFTHRKRALNSLVDAFKFILIIHTLTQTKKPAPKPPIPPRTLHVRLFRPLRTFIARNTTPSILRSQISIVVISKVPELYSCRSVGRVCVCVCGTRTYVSLERRATERSVLCSAINMSMDSLISERAVYFLAFGIMFACCGV